MKEGWKVVKLGEVCKIGIGRTPSRSDKSLWDNEKKTNNKWVSIADMTETLNGFIYETKEHISDKAANNIAVIPKGTILLSFKLTLGKTAIAGNDLYTNEAIANLPIITNEINKEYLLYYFQFFNWVNYAAGDEKVMGKTLNKKKLEILPVIYPPLPEQYRIVKKLDAALEKIDALKAKAEKNIENAKALFQQTLAEELEPKDGWVEKKLGEVCEASNGLWKGKKPPYKKIAVIRNTNFSKDCKLNLENVEYIDVEERQYISRKLEYGDIIIEKSGGSDKQPVGRPILFNVLEGDFSYSNFTSRLRINDLGSVDALYLHKALYHLYLQGATSSLQSNTTGIHNLNLKGYLELHIPLPPLPEQQQIVTKLDNLSAKCKKLEEAERKTIAECDALKQAILRQAFNGEL